MLMADQKKGEIVYVPWNTTDGSGASVSPTVNGTVFATSNALTAQITAGITIAYDYLATGVHLITLDTSDAAYVAENTYTVSNTGLTVGGAAVNVAIASFTLRVNNIDDVYGNGLVRGEYKWSTNTAATDPGSGNVKANNTDYSLITEVYMSGATQKGLNASPIIENLEVGDLIVIAQKNNPDQFFDGIVAAEAVDNGDWYTISLAIADFSGSIANNQAVDVGLLLLRHSGFTSAEKRQMFYRLQIDGDQEAPATDAPNQLPSDSALAVWDFSDAIEAGWTPRQIMRILATNAAGDLSGGGTTQNVLKSLDKAKNRITATVDDDGNRTNVLDAS